MPSDTVRRSHHAVKEMVRELKAEQERLREDLGTKLEYMNVLQAEAGKEREEKAMALVELERVKALLAERDMQEQDALSQVSMYKVT